MNNFSVPEAMTYIATCHHLILKTFGESKFKISRLKQNLQVWDISEILIIICFYLYFAYISSIAHGGGGIFWANWRTFIELSVYIFWTILRSLLQKLNLWIIPKNFEKITYTFFYLSDLILWACVVLAFASFDFSSQSGNL